MTEPVARCESCGSWTYLYALDKLMGNPHFCNDCKAVKAKGSYEVAYARSFLQSNGSMDVRRQEAILACADLRLAMEIAEAEVRALKERINTLRSQISIGQSLSAAIRQQFSAEGVGQYT